LPPLTAKLPRVVASAGGAFELSHPFFSIHGASTMTRLPRTVLLALLFAAGATAHAATVVPLNDTGQTACYDSAGTAVSCATVAADGRYGRDAANAAGRLTKTGAGAAGFDFTKIANDGSVLAAGVALGPSATDWACTKDNVTGLTWEVKTTSGLRSNANTYTWYSTDTTANGGNAGTANGGTCTGSNCDTESFVNAARTAALCSYTDWRMPSPRELQSLVDFSVLATGAAPTIDANYFPNTQASQFWTANNLASNPANAWHVDFQNGFYNSYNDKPKKLYVRLVRGGQ
jgi:hypothetical protein